MNVNIIIFAIIVEVLCFILMIAPFEDDSAGFALDVAALHAVSGTIIGFIVGNPLFWIQASLCIGLIAVPAWAIIYSMCFED